MVFKVAGAPGFEPGNGGTKNRCLTAWLRPTGRCRSVGVYTLSRTGWQSGTRGQILPKEPLARQPPPGYTDGGFGV